MSGKLKTSLFVAAIGCIVFFFVLAPAARAADKTDWAKFDNAVPGNTNTTSTNGRIPLGTDGKGDDSYVYDPCVIKDGYTYKMWYTGYEIGSTGRIYYATCDQLPACTIISIH